MGYIVQGTGWSIGLYEPQGLYLFALGIGIGLYTLFDTVATQRSAIMLTVGIMLASLSLFEFSTVPSEFVPRCNVETGCNPLYAQATVYGIMQWALVLAFASFIMGYGIASFRKHSRREVSNR
jgi:hypothetical protein